MPVWYIDFVLLTPIQGEDSPAYIGEPGGDKKTVKRWQDLESVYQRLRWAVRLMLPAHRGIGWNWQVKGVRSDPYAKFPRWKYVILHSGWALFFYAQSTVMLIVLGWAIETQQRAMNSEFWNSATLNALIGWSGATWVWDRLSCAYHMAAALSVAAGICSTWEWPPLMGSLKDSWSVRQMWSTVYHQTFRRMFSQPAMRITRALGFRKGTLPSRYMQLYLSFGISCILHQFQMFNVTRRDMGEFNFFMSQAVAITIEDFVRWAWRKLHGSSPSRRFDLLMGYAWTFTWFSFSLHVYIKGLVAANVIEDWLFGVDPINFGKSMSLKV
ncbi:uncharacterized protein PV09_04861 [Verruconis gallopava]|uniref:Wax synthase domain-containing protein n=1 Tax=Verruconis gallopava TaxID=253628 RepID=A0A0D2AY36_9PEZI|nr:uncharacterized protein PV09_04861 [Verruconis gallopava]KIW04039.1 hypothetical protein PV09_04861 [Verruconis gallopava]